MSVLMFVNECLEAMMGADSDDMNQTSDDPEVAGDRK